MAKILIADLVADTASGLTELTETELQIAGGGGHGKGNKYGDGGKYGHGGKYGNGGKYGRGGKYGHGGHGGHDSDDH